MAIVRAKIVNDIGPRCVGSVWKGAKKGNGAGRSLGEKLRFRGNSTLVTNLIHQAYGGTLDGADVIVDRLTIFAYSQILGETFPTTMREWSKKGVIRECDRHTIKAERTTRNDLYGQPIDELVRCGKPCPLRDEPSLGVACPKGCKQEGVFYFQIPELISGGVKSPVSLTTHSWLDLAEDGIEGQLQSIAEEFGSFYSNTNGFEMEGFGRRIPLVLYRYRQAIKRPMLDSSKKIQVGSQSVAARTGGKADGETHPLQVDVHPGWRRAYYAWRQVQSVQQLGYQPTTALLKEAGLNLREQQETTGGLALTNWQSGAFEWATARGLSPDVTRKIVNSNADRRECFVELQTAIDRLGTIETVIDGDLEEF